MNTKWMTTCLSLAALSLAACGGGDSKPSGDEAKTTQEVQAEAQAADADSLRASVAKYQEAITAKQGEVDAALAKVKELDPTAALSGEGAELNKSVDALRTDLADLQAKLQIYTAELAKKSAGP